MKTMLQFCGHSIIDPLNPMPIAARRIKEQLSRRLGALPFDQPLKKRGEDLAFWLFYWHPFRESELAGRQVSHFIKRRSLDFPYTLVAFLDDGSEVCFAYWTAIGNYCHCRFAGITPPSSCS